MPNWCSNRMYFSGEPAQIAEIKRLASGAVIPLYRRATNEGISSTTIPVFKYLVDPQMLGVSNSMIYQLTDYIGYDILLQYIQELIQQARAMVATGNYDEAVIGHINDNMNDATRQIAAFQSQVQVQQDALLVVDRQMSYMRQQLSARMLSRYQNNYHFGGSTL